MFRSAVLILSGNAAASLLLLMRNLIVAWMITIEDYGIATTFAVVMGLVEMASALGLHQQIVQSKDGDDEHFQASLQGFQVLRGIIAGVFLFLIAAPIAKFLGIPEVVWAYQLLALVPLIKAFEHFDIHRLNRHMRFGPLILTSSLPALLSLLAIWPLSIWFGDWRIMLYSILTQISLMAITSHLVAERSYRLVLDRAIIAHSFQFGWPILVTSVLLFLVFQGDKMIVGRVLGMEALGIFAMGMTLTLAPILILEKSAQNFFLPQLSRIDHHTELGRAQFQHMAIVVSEVHILLGVGFSCFISVFGPLIISILLGPKFAELVPIFTMLAVLQSIRAIKGGPSAVSLARGQNENTLAASIIRVMLLPAGYFIAVTTERIDYIIILAILGEFLGFLVALALMWGRSKVDPRPILISIFISFFLFLVAIFLDFESISWLVGGSMAVSLFAMYLVMNNLRVYLRNK